MKLKICKLFTLQEASKIILQCTSRVRGESEIVQLTTSHVIVDSPTKHVHFVVDHVSMMKQATWW